MSALQALRSFLVSRLRLPVLSVGERITVLVLCTALPMLMLAIGSILFLADTQRETQRDNLLSTTRAVANTLDSYIARYRALALALAASPALFQENLAAFRLEAARAFPDTADAWLAVSDSSGQQLMNLAVPGGEKLPKRAQEGLEIQQRAFTERTVKVSDVILGPARKIHAVAIEVPVYRDGQPFRSLSVALDVRALKRLLQEQHLPQGWLLGVIDTKGRFVARIPEHDRTVGELASTGWRANRERDGIAEFRSLAGDMVVNANVNLASGWSVGIGVNKALLEAPAWRTAQGATLIGGIVTLVSVLLALAFAKQITGPIHELRDKAQALIEGNPVDVVASMPEVEDVWVSLRKAVAQRRELDRELRMSEEQLRAAAEGARFGAHNFDVRANRIKWSPQLRALLGAMDEEEVTLEKALSFIHPDDREGTEAMMREVLGGKRSLYEHEFRIVRTDGETRWMLDRGQTANDLHSGEVTHIAGILLDITERKELEARQGLLVKELSHRVKNTLAVIQSIARQTARRAPTMDAFIASFEGRLRALSAAQDAIIKEGWRRADVETLLHQQLEPFVGRDGARLTMSGPQISLEAEKATLLGLIVHELATNAAKHGALSMPSGHLSIQWRIVDDTTQPILAVAWRESGGPFVTPPLTQGFGTTLFKQSGLIVTQHYFPTGLESTIEIPSS